MKAALLAACALAAATAAAQVVDPGAGDWDFVATLDGKPIGSHRFTVAGPAGARRVDSQARFAVRWLGLQVYGYAHRAHETWQGDCLRSLESHTDYDGRPESVSRRYDDACLMSYAYWNPRLVLQGRLVDPQTGRPTPVRFDRVPDAPIDVGGRSVRARGWRLAADRQDITVWYAADSGRWIGLDAVVRGGHHLAYRLAGQDPP